MIERAIDWHDALHVVERLSRADQLQLITTLLQRMQDEEATIQREDESIDLLTLSGVGADLWAAVDVDAYLQQERDSWQD